jgi:hypothetical protein
MGQGSRVVHPCAHDDQWATKPLEYEIGTETILSRPMSQLWI